MKKKTRHEIDRFARISGIELDDVGVAQFRAWESTGRVPACPSATCIALRDGKKWWEWTLNEYAALYWTYEWPGWLQLWDDFRNDRAGLKQVMQRVGVAEPEKKFEELGALCR